MSDTLPNVILPRGIWVDLYAETGITVGTRLIVQNLTTSHVRVNTSPTEPSAGYGFNTIPPFKSWDNDDGDSGAWAISTSGGGINVREF